MTTKEMILNFTSKIIYAQRCLPNAHLNRGRELGRRLALREQEIEADARDRAKEREELEDIKAQIFSDKECTNPLAEFERVNFKSYLLRMNANLRDSRSNKITMPCTSRKFLSR